MRLLTETQHEQVDTVWAASTVVAPEEILEVHLTLRRRPGAAPPPVVQRIHWVLPDGLEPVPDPDTEPRLPVEIGAAPSELRFKFRAARETFGEMSAALRLADGGTVELNPVWISVFTPRREHDPEGLSARGRRRLVEVVNARDRNGHIFLADFAAFFSDFLNIHVHEAIAGRLGEELALGDEGLPLDEERRMQIVHGAMTFYGIVRLELEYEEDCIDDDLRPVETPAQRELPEADIEQESGSA